MASSKQQFLNRFGPGIYYKRQLKTIKEYILQNMLMFMRTLHCINKTNKKQGGMTQTI